MHTFLYGAIGGCLIGISASILLLGAGHVMGASGIVTTALTRDAQSIWKLIFLASFVTTSFVIFQPLYDGSDRTLSSLSPAAYGIGGLFVGFGTKLGNGCTSGHGICGLARFSRRSLVSVCTFMLVGIVTAILTQEATSPLKFLSFLRAETDSTIPIYDTVGRVLTMVAVLTAFLAVSFAQQPQESQADTTLMMAKFAPAALAGSLFASGLFISRMVYPSVVMGFLNVALIPKGQWDATLAFVMGFGLLISFASYQWIPSTRLLPIVSLHKTLSCPLMTKQGEFSIPSNQMIDSNLVIGAICFGLGWGISGLCPGPALFLASIGVSWVTFVYWPAFFVGSFLAVRYNALRSSASTQPATAEQSKPNDSSDDSAPSSYGTMPSSSANPEVDV